MPINIIWFRHGLRLHDNPALLEALADCDHDITLLPIFIFDGESSGTKCVGYNRLKFLLDALNDLDQQFQYHSKGLGHLYVAYGNPVSIFKYLHEHLNIKKLCFEQDCEPIWNDRDNAVKQFCRNAGINWVEKIAHTLWNPRKVIDTNGGYPPLTYQMFLHTVQVIGPPPRPEADPNWQSVQLTKLDVDILHDFNISSKIPKPEDFNVYEEEFNSLAQVKWRGGESEALLLLKERIKIEEQSFKCGLYLPNQAKPNILDLPKSMSPHLRFGCLSVRKFYWTIHDIFNNIRQQKESDSLSTSLFITGQLIWREYFYTMSVTNPYYDCMDKNEICLNIPWAPASESQLMSWKLGKTGFPLIDAAMRQLLAEGWIHHILRNAVATFLTRGGLWFSWEHGLQHFLKYLLDADWSVCAGNWMWVSSSAFEHLLDTSMVTCPLALAKRLDPFGVYIKQYVPELSKVPQKYIHEPWLMSLEEQTKSDCLIGVHYPKRIIDFEQASQRNMITMRKLRQSLLDQDEHKKEPPHCRPSNETEIRQFFWLV